MLFMIERFVNPSPIAQIRYIFSSTFCTPIHNPYTFNAADVVQLLSGYGLILQMRSLVIHKLEWKNKEFVENYRHRLFNDDI